MWDLSSPSRDQILESYSSKESESESQSVLSNSLLSHELWSMEFSRPEYWSR